MDNKLITGIIGVVVVVALLGSALVPVIDGLTEGEKTTNEGAGWVRMDYVTGASYDVNVSFDDQGNVRIDTGVPGSGIQDSQTHAADEDTILFASSEISMWLQDGVINILGKDSNGSTIFEQITETGDIATVLNDGTGAQYKHGTEVGTPLSASAWAYVPKPSGNFGFFDAGTPVDMKNYPVAAVGGGFAGVYGFNGLQTYGLGLQLQTELDEDGKLIGGTWVKAAAVDADLQDFDPSTITITPLDPGVISLDPDPDASIMTVPTPTYTDGDWGYNLNISNQAIIVSYSGTGGGPITIPSTVGGYTVKEVGIGNNNASIFQTSLSATDLIIPEGVVKINRSAFHGCSGFTGTLTIPSTVTTIGRTAFSGCSGFTGTLTIPSGVTTIDSGAFTNCSGFTGTLTIPSGVTTIATGAFEGCSGFTGTLTIPSGVTTIATGAFTNCSGFTGTLTIPSSVTTLDTGAFKGTSGLTTFIIPSSVTTINANIFYQSGVKNGIIMSNATPNASAFVFTSSLEQVLDLSDDIDYSVNRYGMSNTVEVSDSMGDAIGYVSFIEIGTDAELSGGAAALLIAVPVVVIAGLLAAFVGYSIVKRF